MAESVTVRVRACVCPGTPHVDGDEVYLVPKIGIEGGTAAEVDLMEAQGAKNPTAFLLSRWTWTFVRYGATGWNFQRLNEQTGRIEDWPFDVDVLLDDYDLTKPVAAKANELYQAQFLDPLLEAAGTTLDVAVAGINRQQRRQKKSSPRGRTAASTSRPPASPPEPSESSLPAGSDGAQLRAVR